MHAQARSKPAKSPADLAAFLQVLADAGISIQSASGSDIEQGGEFAFGLDHDEGDDSPYEAAIGALHDAGYEARIVDSTTSPQLFVCSIPNEAGALLECVSSAIAANAGTDRKIKDISIGTADAQGLVRVQIYSDDPLH